MGIVLVAFLAARIGASLLLPHDINLETHQLGGKLREPIELPLRISVLGGDVLSFYVATLAQSQPNCLGTGGVTSRIDPDRYPIRGTFFGCCARAGKGRAKSIEQKARRVIFLCMGFLVALTLTLSHFVGEGNDFDGGSYGIL